MEENNILPELFEDRIVFMSMYNLGTEEKLHGTHTYKPNGLWNHIAELVMNNLREKESGTSAVFR